MVLDLGFWADLEHVSWFGDQDGNFMIPYAIRGDLLLIGKQENECINLQSSWGPKMSIFSYLDLRFDLLD